MVGIVAAQLEVIHEIRRGKPPAELEHVMWESVARLHLINTFTDLQAEEERLKLVALVLTKRAGTVCCLVLVPPPPREVLQKVQSDSEEGKHFSASLTQRVSLEPFFGLFHYGSL